MPQFKDSHLIIIAVSLAVLVGLAMGSLSFQWGKEYRPINNQTRVIVTSVDCFEDEVIMWDGNAHTLCVPLDDLIGEE